MSDEEKLAPEVVYGAKNIGLIIDEPNPRKVFYRLETGQIPGAKKLGGMWALSVPTWRRVMHGDAV